MLFLDEFEKFAKAEKQTLLYNLLDALHLADMKVTLLPHITSEASHGPV